MWAKEKVETSKRSNYVILTQALTEDWTDRGCVSRRSDSCV